MTRLLTQGDLVRIPQGVELYKEQKHIEPPVEYRSIDLEKQTDKQLYGIYNKKVDIVDYVEVIIEGASWLVKTEDVYKGDNYAD